MTRSAPMDRTIPTFPVLHTPVTSAPKDFAICTAKVPTPPAAPLIKTVCPAWIRPLSRSPCNAVSAAIGTEAACSNVTFSGFITNAASEAHVYSAKAPLHVPNTASPGLNCVTLLPTASTWPDHINPQPFVLWLAQPRGYAKEVREASHEMPVIWIHGSRTNSYQDLIIAGVRPFNFFA